MIRRAGFSVIEALVVLLIGGAALLMIFQVGVQGSQTGLRLGNRALSVADAEPGIESLRLILRGLARSSRSGAAAEGDARGLLATVDLERPTLCAGAGPAHTLELRLVSRGNAENLTCGHTRGEPEVLLELGATRGRFSYSADGRVWRSQLRDVPAEGALYLRLSTDDGVIDIVEQAAVAQ